MYYIYDKYSIHRGKREYFKLKDIQDVILMSFDNLDDIEDFIENSRFEDRSHCWWPIHDLKDNSLIPIKCINEEDAKEKILKIENNLLTIDLQMS